MAGVDPGVAQDGLAAASSGPGRARLTAPRPSNNKVWMECLFMAELPGVTGGSPLPVAAAVADAGLGGRGPGIGVGLLASPGLAAAATAPAGAGAGHGWPAVGQPQEAEEGE